MIVTSSIKTRNQRPVIASGFFRSLRQPMLQNDSDRAESFTALNADGEVLAEKDISFLIEVNMRL